MGATYQGGASDTRLTELDCHIMIRLNKVVHKVCLLYLWIQRGSPAIAPLPCNFVGHTVK